MNTLIFVDRIYADPTANGLRERVLRFCQHCGPYDQNHLRYSGRSDDQSSPCQCCGRTNNAAAPTCRHATDYAILEKYA